MFRAAGLQEKMTEQRFPFRQLRRRRRQPSEHRSERSEQLDSAMREQSQRRNCVCASVHRVRRS
jgi:hypothetical protein